MNFGTQNSLCHLEMRGWYCALHRAVVWFCSEAAANHLKSLASDEVFPFMDTPNVGSPQTCTGNGLSFRPGLQNQSWEARHFPRDILFSPQQLVRPALAMCCC